MVFYYNDGKDVDCTFYCAMLQGFTTITACEHFCNRYYRCDNIASADDEIKEMEAWCNFKNSIRLIHN